MQSIFIKYWFEVIVVVDIEPIKLIPTWTNNRRGDQLMGNMQDRFLMKEPLNPKISKPIMLELGEVNLSLPF